MPRKSKALGAKALAAREKFYKNPDDPRHGKTNGYGNLGCRCERCTEAWRVRHLTYMHGKPERMEKHAEREMKRRGAKRQRAYKVRPNARAKVDGTE
jgi:hypothetical protein